MEWLSGNLDVAGNSLEYACWGPPPGAAPTLVLLHEGLGSVGLWRDWPAQLAKATGYGVLVYSRAGYGRSSTVTLPRPPDYMSIEAETVLGRVLDAAGVTSAVLLGHSDGATIAAIYAGSVSDMRVRGLILMAPHFFCEPIGVEAISRAKVAYETEGLKERMARHHDAPDVAFYGWHDVWTDPANDTWSVADCIDHWRIPALAIQGTADAYGTLDQIDEIEGRIYAPFEKLILDGIGHAPHQEATDKVTSAVADFCTRLRRIESQVVDIPEAG
ncbi:alpha/beta hydrolase [uncultured Tateyamaria sp.]|uniref:alpha/beta fold hydrolase n=1 Tax=uncultured Tateyamaria sp. TaxID=455651 RepID=UPI00261F3A16|nr:alpha/beta hydrolase [uncultured Tateyamaria sp.]